MTLDIRQHFESQAPFPIALGSTLSTHRVTAVRLETIKTQIHQQILTQVDLRRMETMSPEALRLELKALTQRLLDESGLAINETERRQIVQGIQDEMLGLGPIEPLLADPSVSDILVNGPNCVY
ncbi:MAG: CpaF family protein, partial [Burkholderiales bacterium]